MCGIMATRLFEEIIGGEGTCVWHHGDATV